MTITDLYLSLSRPLPNVASPLYTSIPESIFQSYQNKDIALTITRASDDADAKLASIFGNNIPPGLKDGFLVSGEDGQFLLPAKDKEAGYADLDGTSQTGSNFNGGPGSNNAARNPMLSLVGKTPFIAIAPRNAILNARLKYKTALEQSQCRQRDIVATSYLDWL